MSHNKKDKVAPETGKRGYSADMPFKKGAKRVNAGKKGSAVAPRPGSTDGNHKLGYGMGGGHEGGHKLNRPKGSDAHTGGKNDGSRNTMSHHSEQYPKHMAAHKAEGRFDFNNKGIAEKKAKNAKAMSKSHGMHY